MASNSQSYLTNETEITSIANAIRAKKGDPATTKYQYPAGMVTAIGAIQTRLPEQTKTATIGGNLLRIVLPDSGYTLSLVTVPANYSPSEYNEYGNAMFSTGLSTGKALYEPTNATLTNAGLMTALNIDGSEVYYKNFGNSYNNGYSNGSSAGYSNGYNAGKSDYNPTYSSLDNSGNLIVYNGSWVARHTNTFSNNYNDGYSKGYSAATQGNAYASYVLYGYTFTSANAGVGATGTMPNRGNWAGTIGASRSMWATCTIPAGYHAGSGYISAGLNNSYDYDGYDLGYSGYQVIKSAWNGSGANLPCAYWTVPSGIYVRMIYFTQTAGGRSHGILNAAGNYCFHDVDDVHVNLGTPTSANWSTAWNGNGWLDPGTVVHLPCSNASTSGVTLSIMVGYFRA